MVEATAFRVRLTQALRTPRYQSNRGDVRLRALASEFLASTPGKLTLGLIVSIILLLLAGISSSVTVLTRDHRYVWMLNEAEPVSNSAQVIYTSLSAINSNMAQMAASVDSQNETSTLRYTASLATVSSAIITASSGNGLQQGDHSNLEYLMTINRELPIYTSLVEKALALMRLGKQSSITYLDQASQIMKDYLLPSAEELYKNENNLINAKRNNSLSIPLNSIVFLALTLLAISTLQWWLRVHTKRMFNLGLSVAIGSVAIMTVWMLASGWASSIFINQAEKHGFNDLQTLTRARIYAQQARQAEVLTIISPDRATENEQEYRVHMNELMDTLTHFAPGLPEVRITASEAARNAVSWDTTHRRLNARVTNGLLDRSIAAYAPEQESHDVAEVDYNFSDAIKIARQEFRNRVYQAGLMLRLAFSGTIILSCIALIGIIVGMIPRIREYQ